LERPQVLEGAGGSALATGHRTTVGGALLPRPWSSPYRAIRAGCRTPPIACGAPTHTGAPVPGAAPHRGGAAWPPSRQDPAHAAQPGAGAAPASAPERVGGA